MAAYKDGVQWIADNDDANLGEPDDGGYIVTIMLVANIFGKDPDKVYKDVVARRKKDTRR